VDIFELQSAEVIEIHAALSKSQADMPTLLVDSSGYSGKYVSLPGIIAHIRKPLTDNGLSYTQEINEFDGKYFLITTLRHSSGQWIRCKAPLFLPVRDEIPSNKDYNQECGKAISYMRRYSLESLLGLKGDKDDFDNDANDVKKQPAQQAQPVKQLIRGDQVKALIEAIGDDSELIDLILKTTKVSDLSKMSEKQYYFVLKNFFE